MKKILILLLCTAALHTKAQNTRPVTINSAGHTATVEGNIHEWSIGEIAAVATISNPAITITQGLLQPGYRAELVTVKNANDLFLVYPVPASSFVYIKPGTASGSKLELSLFDASGKWVLGKESQLTSGKELQMLDVRKLAPGSYLLRIVSAKNDESYSATWKLIKNN